MAAGVGNPCDGVAGAAGVLGLAGLLGVAALAPVEGEELVAELTAGGDGEDVVGGAVEGEVGDGSGAAVAAAELGSGDDGDGLESVFFFNSHVSLRLVSLLCHG